MQDEDLSLLHLEYCIFNCYYDEALEIKDKFYKKHPNSNHVNAINKLFPNDKYNKKSKKYNKSKKDSLFEDCSCCGSECCTIEWCDCCDVLIDFGKNDTGCIDIDLCCFCD